MMANAWYEDVLPCPDCLAAPFNPLAGCSSCGFKPHVPRDLRASTYERRARLDVPARMPPSPSDALDALDTSKPKPLADVPMPGRDSRELLSLIRERFPHGGDVLDLGCGPRDQAEPFKRLGFRYVGIDYDGLAADLLADGHALPFRDASFDVVFSFAVLEHLHTPARAIAEVARVLRPGGVYVGTVSQGEPFHASYFHFTPWGMVAMFDGFATLDVVRLWTSHDTLRALSRMGRYPRIIRLMLASLDRIHAVVPWLAPRRMKLTRKQKEIDSLYRAGSLCFVIAKS